MRPARLLALVALVAAVPLWPAAWRVRAMQLQPGAVRELARGKLLVASRALEAPAFAQSVVLLADYNAQGAMGLIINHRTDVPLTKLLPELKPGPGRAPVVFFGGPVESPGVMALLRAASPGGDARRIIDNVYQIVGPTLLDKEIESGTGDDKLRVYFGYAGWAPGQLENETRAGAWHVFDADASIVFDPDPESLWRRQIPRADQLMAAAGPPAHVM